MSPGRQSYNLAIVGGGRQGLALLEALTAHRRETPLKVVAVADRDPEAPGLRFAREHRLLTTSDAGELLKLPEVDIIVNATGDPELSRKLEAEVPERCLVLNLDRPVTGEDFFDLISMELAPLAEDQPLKLGLVGAGKAGYEVLEHLTRDERYRGRLRIIGVADPNPEAPGLRLARELGLPTYSDCMPLLAAEPDLILELTGDAEVRDRILQAKGPATQIIDHVKARLFWDLLKREEERLRQKVAQELRLAGQRSHFQRIFDHLPDPVIVLRSDYMVEEANRPFLQRFRKSPEEVIGHPCYEVFHHFDEPCDRKGMTCPLHRVLETHETAQVLQTSRNPDGTVRYDEITMSPLTAPGWRRPRVIEVIKDVTERKKLEAELRHSEQRAKDFLLRTIKDKIFLETIVNGIADHMMVIDLDYRIIEVNRALLEMVGKKKEQVVGRHCYEISHHLQEPCQLPDHPCPLKEAVQSDRAASATHVHFDREGRERYYHVVCHPLKDESGRVVQVVDLSRDITQEVMGRMRSLHEDKMASLGKLAASVVHEINNPLTGILNFIKLMQATMDQGTLTEADLADFRRYLDVVYQETQRVSRTLANLLTFSRKTKPEARPLDLNAVLEAALSLVSYQLRLQGITVERRYAPDLAPVLADKGQMTQVFLNLFLNAIDAMPEGGTLTLTTRNTRRREVEVKVTDTGKGIPKEHISQIFEPFFTTKKAASGAGLGLSVVYGIIRDHKGIIKVDSVVGKGSTFTLRLPAHIAKDEHVAA
ncbi:MAG: PAS domain-containing protein [Syntrophobacterales bacterium]|nr:PAS domain-containing protein [Syntrophobacterales bacterium]